LIAKTQNMLAGLADDWKIWQGERRRRAMHPVVRALGKVLRLVGISSPKDAKAKKEAAGGPPSWRKTAAANAEEGAREGKEEG
jgi:hypothetical protein